MKKIISLFSMLMIVAIAACQQPGKEKKSLNETISADQFEKMLAETKDVQLVDVRTADEYNSGHIKGSTNLDFYNQSFRDELAKLNKEKPVMVYCKSGGRSGQAAGMLAEMGFKEIYNLQGGMIAWANADKAIETSGDKPAPAGMSMDDYSKLVSSKPMVLVDFNAVWCMPCKKLAPILDELVKKQEGKLTLVKVDADENAGLLREKKIEGIPYLELYKDGKLVWSNMGLTDEATIAAQLK